MAIRMTGMVLLACLAAAPAVAGQRGIGDGIGGIASVIDGHTLVIDGQRIELFGLAAPAAGQTCPRPAGLWHCGAAAKQQLQFWTLNRVTRCIVQAIGAAGEYVAVCYAAGKDLGAELVGNGYALALPDSADRYARDQATAQRHRLGLWAARQ